MTINTWWNETISLPDMSHIEIVQKPLFIQKVRTAPIFSLSFSLFFFFFFVRYLFYYYHIVPLF